ncbi:MAG TPA: 1-(5-phosphoribosyl)-5-[(5-phosphoribosylamino)methylideneamino]imidazole-4-carboxamide isomerase [Methanotrichaceae archaeon]|nr:1-(5-phosphoribosyl)-5-[(5-phosphoribosylamino)methylideneamino]imidazole-4-carboxamide isomerase [Methanotrichaceae archaeon]
MSFDLFPAVDLRGGKCVQLVGGVPGSEVVKLDDPLSQARRWIDLGSKVLHVIDLDGAIEGVRINASILKEIVSNLDVFIQVGGGIRTEMDVDELLGLGIDRVMIGTAALKDPEMVKKLSARHGSEKIMVALDVKRGLVTTEGWQRVLNEKATGLGQLFEKMGAGAILFTNIDIEGQQRGVNIAPARQLIESVGIPVVVAGGVTTIEDILSLRDAGAAGAVVGTAIYTGKLDFGAALKALGKI